MQNQAGKVQHSTRAFQFYATENINSIFNLKMSFFSILL